MARHPPRRDLSATPSAAENAAATEHEGSEGEAGGQEDAASDPAPDAPPKEVRPRRYRVTNAHPVQILYDGAAAMIRPGKIVDAHTYNLEHLRLQGVTLEEVSA